MMIADERALDTSQERVLQLDPARHARIVGASGTGKTTLVVRSIERCYEQRLVHLDDILVLAPQRGNGDLLRDRIEEELAIPLRGRLVRTPTSFAYAVVARARLTATEAGEPELVTGAIEDQILEQVIAAHLDAYAGDPGTTDLLESERFTSELRDLWRVLNETTRETRDLRNLADDVQSGQIPVEGVTNDERSSLSNRWHLAATLLDHASDVLETELPGGLTASGLIREATRLLQTAGDVELESLIPRLILIDNAEELTEGALRLVAACAARGASLWCFGDPDTSTSAYQGEGTGVLRSIRTELERLGAPLASYRLQEQVVILERVYRHGEELRDIVRGLTDRVGTGTGWQHRVARAEPSLDTSVAVTRVHSRAEQAGVIAHLLQSEHLGVGREPSGVPWSDMAVICRSNDEAAMIARLLASMGVPTERASGGLILRDEDMTRHLLEMLAVTLGLREPNAAEIEAWLQGPFGGLDPVSIRRLRQACLIEERRRAKQEGRAPRTWAALLLELMTVPQSAPDTAEGRQAQCLARTLRAGAAAARIPDASAREVLWALWDAAGLAEDLRSRALSHEGIDGSAANRDLDAVMALFFTLQRHEERASSIPVEALLEDLLTSKIPQDTLAAKSLRPAVTVTTPHGVTGREYAIVAVVGPQDGEWPNMRPRGSLLGVPIVERAFRYGRVSPSTPTETLHDELRLFVQAVSRGRRQVLVVARDDEDDVPSLFYQLLQHREVTNLPNSHLTLRGHVASLRRNLVQDPDDLVTARELALLAQEGATGADPETWYGVRPMSTTAPLVDLSEPEAVVHISPSAIERAETCPLDWALHALGGAPTFARASIGTLIHHLFESSDLRDPAEWEAIVEAQWEHLTFEADWDSHRRRQSVTAMLEGLSDYLRSAEASGTIVLAQEAPFTVHTGRARVRGVIDRVELRRDRDGGSRVVIVDLKTGSRAPSKREMVDDPQLLAYQLGLASGAVEVPGVARMEGEPPLQGGGASLLFVSPDVQNQGKTFREFMQDPIDDERREQFLARVEQLVDMMAAASFDARVEHHCAGSYRPQLCSIHIIPAVSHA